MHIVVCVKQVPRENAVKIRPDLSIDSEGIEPMMNLFDEYAVEEALKWNEEHGGQVTALSIGPAEWTEQLRRALAMGATDAVLLDDPAFFALDALGAGRVAAAAIQKLGDVDLVVCGRNSTDDESGAFGPILARLLGFTALTYVGAISSLDPAAKTITVERQLEDAVETVSAKLPAVVTVNKDINEPRYPSLLRIKKVAKVEIPTWHAADLSLDAAALEPAVRVSARVPPTARPNGQMIEGRDAGEKVRNLLDALSRDQVL